MGHDLAVKPLRFEAPLPTISNDTPMVSLFLMLFLSQAQKTRS